MERTYHCAKIAKGTAEAEALVSKDAVCFYLVVPETGELIERNHDINGKNVAGKILIMPSGKGSSVVQADGLYKLLMKGKHPAGLIEFSLNFLTFSSASFARLVVSDITTT